MNYNQLTMAELIRIRKSIKKEIQVLENKKLVSKDVDQISDQLRSKTDHLNLINAALKPLLDQDTKNLLR